MGRRESGNKIDRTSLSASSFFPAGACSQAKLVTSWATPWKLKRLQIYQTSRFRFDRARDTVPRSQLLDSSSPFVEVIKCAISLHIFIRYSILYRSPGSLVSRTSYNFERFGKHFNTVQKNVLGGTKIAVLGWGVALTNSLINSKN